MNSRIRLLNSICVALCAFIGVLTRVLLSHLSNLTTTELTFNNKSILLQDSTLSHLGSGFFLQNILGSFVLGCLAVISFDNRFWPMVKTGVGSGFCGSCTTFATWQLGVSVLLFQHEYVTAITQSIVTVATSFCAFLLGHQLSSWTQANKQRAVKLDPPESAHSTEGLVTNGNQTRDGQQLELEEKSPKQHAKQGYVPTTAHLIILGSVFLLCLIGLLVAALLVPKSSIWSLCAVSMLFGPLGAVLRYQLSIYNAQWPRFPLFTFIANLLASAVNMAIFVCAIIITEEYSSGTSVSFTYWVVQGVSTGAMGSLSTVSTWIGELHKLSNNDKLVWAHIYGLTSVLAAQLVCAVIAAIFLATTSYQL